MAIKRGYKQTELGVIPEGWTTTSITRVSEMTTVGFVGSMSHLFTRSGVPVLRGQDVLPNRLDPSETKFISPETHKVWKKSALKGGDVVMVRVGVGAGTACVIPHNLGEANAASIVVIRPAATMLEASFLSTVINSDFGQRQVSSILIGGAQPVINTATVAAFKVPLPPLHEQRAIACALSDADAWIESLEQLMAKKRHIKQGVMQELLTGRRRLPGFSGQWETKRLGDLGRCQRGVSYNPLIDLFSGDTNSSVRLLRSNNVQDAKIVYSDMQFVASSRVSSEQYLQKNDVLICMANGSRDLVGKAGRYCEERGSAYTFGAFMGGFRPAREMANPAFCFYLFQTAEYRQHIAILLAGSSINNLTPDNLESHLVVVPNTMVEQTAISTVLSDMDTEIASLESKLAKAREVKQGMMQELLTGRIRLGIR